MLCRQSAILIRCMIFEKSVIRTEGSDCQYKMYSFVSRNHITKEEKIEEQHSIQRNITLLNKVKTRRTLRWKRRRLQ